MKEFNHIPNNVYSEQPQPKVSNVDGMRQYIIGEEAFPSITSILNRQMDTEGLDAWRERVGKDVANHICRSAMNRGNIFHKICEDYLSNNCVCKFENHLLEFGMFMFEVFASSGCARLGKLYLKHGVVETPIFMPVGTAGTIKAVLIDDDKNLREGMKKLLALFAPKIKIIGEADSVATGVETIDRLQPQVVFLDIQLNDGTGFDILEKIAEKSKAINSNIVFITAHEQYAIKAFRFSALDFLLKPVDPEELQKVIEKIEKVLINKNDYSHIDLLLENIRKNVDNFKRIALSTQDGIHLFDISDIIRCESEDNYTKFYIKDHKPILISKTLDFFLAISVLSVFVTSMYNPYRYLIIRQPARVWENERHENVGHA